MTANLGVDLALHIGMTHNSICAGAEVICELFTSGDTFYANEFGPVKANCHGNYHSTSSFCYNFPYYPYFMNL